MIDDIRKAQEIIKEEIGIKPSVILLSFAVAKVLNEEEQFRFPRSKKKRIQEKWANNPKNYRPLSKND